MRQALFWVKMAPYIPYLLRCAKKAKTMPFEERYAYAREVLEIVLKKLHVEIHVFGTERLVKDGPVLFVGNHQSSIDAFVYLYANSVANRPVSKVEGKKIPVLSAWYDALGTIYFDRSDMRDALRMVKDVTQALIHGDSVTIFPEGTRSKIQHMGEFKPGALKPAMMAKKAIQPFALVNAYIPLDSNEEIKPVYCIFLPAIPYESIKDKSTTEVAAFVQNQIREAIRQYA